ncbi:LysM peptidoglycan-binding domain-containing protein [Lewinella sp. IMCC34191]|uniref:muramidase family protein n=1 Tax=Lewinella sp. IMCC34191 TaxID=2259172 RepID=UPI000E26F4D9|nr:LysM peptidoglycan-binding domain-containing protein [Lewinella sp. IMCC34191]
MRSLFVILASLWWGQGYAAQVYLLFSQECGERIRYERTVEDVAQMDYFSYSLPAGFGMRMLLETDAAGATVRNRRPEEALSCASFTITEDQAARINDGVDHLFMLTALPDGGYRQEPVLMAAILHEMDGRISYRSPLASYSFDRENSVIGVNLDTGEEGADVQFEGQQGSGCERTYLLRQHKPGTAYPYMTYRIAPDLGVVERHLTGDGRFSKGESIVAVHVNQQGLSEYLQGNCEKSTPATTFVPLYIEPDPVTAANPAGPQIAEAETKTVEPTPTTASSGAAYTTTPSITAEPATIHTVSAGETLYAISRRYGVTVMEIQQANQLSGSTINIGQQLVIAGSRATAPAPATSQVNIPPSADPMPTPAQSSQVQVVVPPAADAQPPLNPSSSTPQPVYGSENTSEYHVVKAGETFASLARRYGYTTERFKEFNNMSEAPVALVGQRLKTSHCSCPPTAEENSRPAPATTVDVPSAPEDYPVSYPTSQPVVPPSQYQPVSTMDEGGTNEEEYSRPNIGPPAYGAPLEQDRAVHVVKDGESLYGIARQYRMTVEELRELNELLPADVIVPYQKLYVN